MILLATMGHPQAVRWRHPNGGRLVQPRHFARIADTARAGIPWAADNDAFNGDWNEERWEQMLHACARLPGCLFATARDVVGDAHTTLLFFEEYASMIGRYGLPVALVLQDGIESSDVPWGALDAVFIGGTDAFKLGSGAAAIARAARERGKWVHMGRVNSAARVRYAAAIGCDSFDGTQFSRWRSRWMPEGLAWAQAGEQLRVFA